MWYQMFCLTYIIYIYAKCMLCLCRLLFSLSALLVSKSYFSNLHTGKTNHGMWLYGYVMTHILVELCSLGGIVLYLTFWFVTTKEFDLFTVEDWLDNNKWFDIKLLVDASCYKWWCRSLQGHGKQHICHISAEVINKAILRHLIKYFIKPLNQILAVSVSSH
jgi:hypothetical protein